MLFANVGVRTDELFQYCLLNKMMSKTYARQLAAQYSGRVRNKTVRNIDKNSPLGIYLKVEKVLKAKGV